jgi:ankyrin repeat protein
MPICINPRTSLATNSFSRVELPQTSVHNKSNLQNDLPIVEAVCSGDVKGLHEEISKCNSDIHQDYQSNGATCRSPLIYLATKERHPDVIKVLLDYGVDINVCNEEENSALLLACSIGNKEIVKLLLEYGADSNLAKSNGEAPLYRAVYYGYKEIVDLLLSNGADVNQICKTKPEQVYGVTPLYSALIYGYKEIAKSLIELGAEVNILCGSKGTLPLTIAATNGDVDMVKLLLESGANINMDSYNSSPLESACEKGHFDIAKILLRGGADLSAKVLMNCKRLTKDKHPEIYRLIKACVKIRISEKNQDIPGVKNQYLETPIVAACRAGDKEWLKKVIKDCPYAIYSTYREDNGFLVKKTLLSIACKSGNQEIVEFLIDNGVDINMCNSDGEHPLYSASSKGHYKIVNMLIKKGADPEEFDKCLAIAIKKDYDTVINILKNAQENSKQEKKFPDNTERYAFDNLAFVKG